MLLTGQINENQELMSGFNFMEVTCDLDRTVLVDSRDKCLIGVSSRACLKKKEKNRVVGGWQMLSKWVMMTGVIGCLYVDRNTPVEKET